MMQVVALTMQHSRNQQRTDAESPITLPASVNIWLDRCTTLTINAVQ
jgi:hypothetical protein